MRNRVNQRELLFYIFYKKFKDGPIEEIDGVKMRRNDYHPLWKLMGEWYVEGLGRWEFMSYEISTTMSKLKRDEPLLFDERKVTLKNGRQGKEYRLRSNIKFEDIKTEEIKNFLFFHMLLE